MNGSERRRYKRYDTEMRAELYVENETISAIMIDIGKCGMALISENEISPGTDIQIRIKHAKEFTIQGTVKWVTKIREAPSILYRMGIETKGAIILEDIADTGFPEQTEYIKSLLSKNRPVKSVLVIDDEEVVCNLFKEALEKFGYEVTVACDGEEGLKLFRKHPTDLIITDIFMPKKDGHTLILEIKEEFPETKIFAITGKVSFDPEMELEIAQKLGAAITFRKPVKFSALIGAIKGLTVS
jgi:CheY-like chemotaxis protein